MIGTFIFRYTIFSGIDRYKSKDILKLLSNHSIFSAYVLQNNHHSHGYMRLKKPRRL